MARRMRANDISGHGREHDEVESCAWLPACLPVATTYPAPPTPDPTKTGAFRDAQHYNRWKLRNTKCTCDYDDYDGCIRLKVDCPDHGERDKNRNDHGGGSTALVKNGATDTQVGGDHYAKMAIQPVDYIVRNGIPFREGCAIKYITRHRNKNGAEDIRKAIHFLNMILEDYENAH